MLLNLSMEQIGKMPLSEITGILAGIAAGDNTASTDTLTLLNIRYQEQISIDSYNMANLTSQDIISLANRLIQQGLLTSDEVAAMLSSKVDQSYVDTTVAAAISNLIGAAPSTLATLSALAAAIQNDETLLDNLAYVVRYDTNTQNLTDVQKQNALTNIGGATIAQGNLASTAVQPGDLAVVATSGSYTNLTDTPNITSIVNTAISVNNASLPTQTEVNDLQTAVAGLTSSLANETPLSSFNLLQTQVSTNEATLNLAVTDINTNTADITTLNSEVTTNTNSITSLTTELHTLETTVANLPTGGGTGGGGADFEVVDWDPITIGQSTPVQFTPLYSSSHISNTGNDYTINSSNDGTSPIVTIYIYNLPFEAISGQVSNSTSGTFTFTNIPATYTPFVVLFSKSQPQLSDINGTFSGGLQLDGNVGYMVSVTNGDELSPGIGTAIQYQGISNGAIVSNSATIQNLTETSITFSNGTITTTAGSATVDLDTYSYMTIVSFADLVGVLGHVTPNNIPNRTFTTDLNVTLSYPSTLPMVADGTVLRVVGHDGTLSNNAVKIGDLCQVYNNGNDFLITRPFDLALADAMAPTGVLGEVLSTGPQVVDFVVSSGGSGTTNQTLKLTGTTVAGSLTVPYGNQTVGPYLDIASTVRTGEVTIVNRSINTYSTFVTSRVPLTIIYPPYTNNGYSLSVGSNARASIPDSNHVYSFNGIQSPLFTTSVYTLNFTPDVGVINLKSMCCSEKAPLPSTLGFTVGSAGNVTASEYDGTLTLTVTLDASCKSGYVVLLNSNNSVFSYGNIPTNSGQSTYTYTLSDADITNGSIQILLNQATINQIINISYPNNFYIASQIGIPQPVQSIDYDPNNVGYYIGGSYSTFWPSIQVPTIYSGINNADTAVGVTTMPYGGLSITNIQFIANSGNVDVQVKLPTVPSIPLAGDSVTTSVSKYNSSTGEYDSFIAGSTSVLTQTDIDNGYVTYSANFPQAVYNAGNTTTSAAPYRIDSSVKSQSSNINFVTPQSIGSTTILVPAQYIAYCNSYNQLADLGNIGDNNFSIPTTATHNEQFINSTGNFAYLSSGLYNTVFYDNGNGWTLSNPVDGGFSTATINAANGTPITVNITPQSNVIVTSDAGGADTVPALGYYIYNFDGEGGISNKANINITFTS